MRFRALALAGVLATTAGTATAGDLDLNLSTDALRFGARQPLNDEGLEVDGDWLHEQDNGDVLGLGLHIVNDAQPRRGTLKLGIGGKLFYVNGDDSDVDGAALALGGRFRYTWPTFNRFAVGGQLYYAPDVTAGGDIDSYAEGALRAEYLALRNASVYVGLRGVRVGLDDRSGSKTFESGPHLGVRLSF